jgi:hypothetical protein
MSVLVRSKRGGAGLRQRRQGLAARGREQGTAPREERSVSELRAATMDHRRADRRRELGPQQDQALYSCACGFVFKAPVSTSVGCPHCGTAQAW